MSVVVDTRLSKDVKNESALVYTARRDIHAVGIVFLQMLLGLDVMQKFDDIRSAVHSRTLSFVAFCCPSLITSI